MQSLSPRKRRFLASFLPCISPDTSKIHPLPLAKVLVLCLTLMTNSMVQSMLYSFVGFMVDDFGIAESKETVGYYAGYLAGSYYFGQLVGGSFWGHISDSKGRRPVFLIGLTCSLLCTLGFGLSRWYWMAVMFRFLAGATNANYAIGKSYLGDITDKTNKTRAFSTLGIAWGTGSMIGPIIGGYASQPATKHPNTFGKLGFFVKFPYVLPCLICGSLIACSMILVIKFLPETVHLKRAKTLKALEDTVNDPSAVELSITAPEGDVEGDVEEEGVETELLESEGDETNGQEALLGSTAAPEESKWQQIKKHILTNKPLLACLAAYWVVSFIFVCHDEVWPLWALSSKEVHGLEFETDQLGTVYSIAGAFLLFFVLVIYPKLAGAIGALYTIRLGAVIGIALYLVWPAISYVGSTGGTWVTLILLTIIRVAAGSMCFTSVNILINNTADNRTMGLANGIAYSGSGLFKGLGPTVGGNIYAWSVATPHKFPFNYTLLWWVMMVLNGCTLLTTIPIPRSADHFTCAALRCGRRRKSELLASDDLDDLKAASDISEVHEVEEA